MNKPAGSTCLSCAKLTPPKLGNGRHHFSRQSPAAHHLVSGDVVCHQPKKRSQRSRAATSVGTGRLQDGMVRVA